MVILLRALSGCRERFLINRLAGVVSSSRRLRRLIPPSSTRKLPGATVCRVSVDAAACLLGDSLNFCQAMTRSWHLVCCENHAGANRRSSVGRSAVRRLMLRLRDDSLHGLSWQTCDEAERRDASDLPNPLSCADHRLAATRWGPAARAPASPSPQPPEGRHRVVRRQLALTGCISRCSVPGIHGL
jgi:hypothetical protein